MIQFNTGQRVKCKSLIEIAAATGSELTKNFHNEAAPFFGTVISSEIRENTLAILRNADPIKTEYVLIKFDDGFVVELPDYILLKV